MQCRDYFISCPTSSDFVLSLPFLFTRPLEAYGSQLPPRCFTLRVQHLVLGSASYSDATARLQHFGALLVSHSLHGKKEYQN